MSLESYLILLVAVFSASLSHCIGMCGGIVLGLNMQRFSGSSSLSCGSGVVVVDSKMTRVIANVIYFLGRSVSYICIGLIFCVISVNFGFSDTAQGVILILLGILLFAFAFSMTFFPKFLNVFSTNNRFFSWYKRVFKFILSKNNFSSFFFIGLLNGFLPCHLVYMFALKAASSMDLLQSIFIMLVFCLGTFLPLFITGIFSGSLLNSRARDIFLKISFIIMTYFAFSNIYKGVSRFSGEDMHMQHHMQHMQHSHSQETGEMLHETHGASQSLSSDSLNSSETSHKTHSHRDVHEHSHDMIMRKEHNH